MMEQNNQNDDIIDRSSLDRPNYLGLSNESDEELYFLYWSEELINQGYIISIERAKSFVLAEPFNNVYRENVILKTKIKTKEKIQKLLHGHVYTPEYKIIWNNKAIGIFVENQNLLDSKTTKFLGRYMLENSPTENLISFIEVKPIWDMHNMTRLVKINQNWMYEKFKIFVNITIPELLFELTFTPNKYLIKESGRKRTIKFPVRTLEEFLKQ